MLSGYLSVTFNIDVFIPDICQHQKKFCNDLIPRIYILNNTGI